MASARVLYLIGSSGIGGVESFLLQTARFHNTEKVDPHYFLLRDGVLAESLRNLNRPVIVANGIPRLSRPWTCLQAILQIKKYCLAHQIDLVHSAMAYGALFGAPAAKWAGVRHLWFQHGPVGGWMDRLAYRLDPDHILFNSESTWRAQETLNGVEVRPSWRRYRLGADVPIGAEISEVERQKTRSSWDIQEGERVLLMLCRLQTWKGVDLFIEALSEAQKQRPQLKLKGLVFGAVNRPSDRDNLQSQIDRLQAPVRLMEPTPNPWVALQAADTLVNASRSEEPFGLTIIEAMWWGQVPIVPNRGGPREIVEEAQVGIQFESGSSTSLAQSILKWADTTDPSQAQKAQHYARKNHDSRSQIKELESIYLDLL